MDCYSFQIEEEMVAVAAAYFLIEVAVEYNVSSLF